MNKSEAIFRLKGYLLKYFIPTPNNSHTVDESIEGVLDFIWSEEIMEPVAKLPLSGIPFWFEEDKK